MQTPTVLKLRWPCFEREGVTNNTSQVLVIEPADGRFVCLDANGYTVIPCTSLSFGFARVARSKLVSCLQCAHGQSLTCATAHSRSGSSGYRPAAAMSPATWAFPESLRWESHASRLGSAPFHSSLRTNAANHTAHLVRRCHPFRTSCACHWCRSFRLAHGSSRYSTSHSLGGQNASSYPIASRLACWWRLRRPWHKIRRSHWN